LSQYFENDLSLKSKVKFIHYMFHGESFTFKTDYGVFSKDEVDLGSVALLEVVRAYPFSGPILDVGCGYGVLGIILSRISGQEVHMFDVNERAVNLAKENITLNNVTNIKVAVNHNYQGLTKNYYDLVVINPPIRAGKETVYMLLGGAKDYLTDGGALYFVIRKSHGARSAEKAMKEVYTSVELIKKDKGYYIYKATK
jgi:16S rRNA (guanine1207-N2)-methyltransferase